MKLSGTAQLSAPPQRVWEALNDPAVLARTIPGCQQLEETGPDEYKMTVSAGVASIKGTYLGQVRLADRQEPTSYVLHAAGSGGPGTVSAECLVRLDADGDGTTLSYDADAVIGGVIAGVGQRVLAGVAKKMAGQFFSAVDAELSGASAQLAAPAADESRGYADYREQPTVFAGPARSPWGDRNVPVDVRPFLVGGVAGAVIALAGVLVGSRLGRGR
ncbi:MAG: carbon monoxide dehydrogenase subunit G [Geodermatophilaceae bacterium]|nr:carbon monoxide dehydrogenase subunit G [Geodermatophilaceae bacterium]MDQ3464445.1 carbon monoxide dehydrogenase subunit G [Actinomycetota bacterium]